MAKAAVRKSAPRVSAVQRRYLFRRIEEAQRERNSRLWSDSDKPKEPAHIKKARADLRRARLIVEGYDMKATKSRDNARFANNAAAEKCREAVLFSTPDEALRLVQQYERNEAGRTRLA